MKNETNQSLFTEINAEEASQVNGGFTFYNPAANQVLGLISGIFRNPNNPALTGASLNSINNVRSSYLGRLLFAPFGRR